jgi:hypothetical protein
VQLVELPSVRRSSPDVGSEVYLPDLFSLCFLYISFGMFGVV